jgi:hypothetical protein
MTNLITTCKCVFVKYIEDRFLCVYSCLLFSLLFSCFCIVNQKSRYKSYFTLFCFFIVLYIVQFLLFPAVMRGVLGGTSIQVMITTSQSQICKCVSVHLTRREPDNLFCITVGKKLCSVVVTYMRYKMFSCVFRFFVKRELRRVPRRWEKL